MPPPGPEDRPPPGQVESPPPGPDDRPPQGPVDAPPPGPVDSPPPGPVERPPSGPVDLFRGHVFFVMTPILNQPSDSQPLSPIQSRSKYSDTGHSRAQNVPRVGTEFGPLTVTRGSLLSMHTTEDA